MAADRKDITSAQSGQSPSHFRGVRIPSRVLELVGTRVPHQARSGVGSTFTHTHAAFLGIVELLSRWGKGGCWATDVYLAAKLKKTTDRVAQVLRDCRDMGLLKHCGVQDVVWKGRTYRRRILRVTWDRRPPPDPDLKTMLYVQYLQTEHWQQVRTAALRRAASRCQLCNSSQDLEVHHRTYERRGEELPSDLTVLCEPCHEKFHDILPKEVDRG